MAMVARARRYIAKKALYEQDVPMTSWWQNDAIVWPAGIKRMDLVMKDGSGGGGHVHKRTDPEKFFPTKMRITMVQVSAGSTYDASLVPGLRAKNTLVERNFFSKTSCASDMGCKRKPCSTEMLNPTVSSPVAPEFRDWSSRRPSSGGHRHLSSQHEQPSRTNRECFPG